MKKAVVVIGSFLILTSCGVQQFQVNSEYKDFQNGNRITGESTRDLQRGKDYVKSGTIFLLGINILNDAKVTEMANSINADKYTIETKSNFLSVMCNFATGGLVSYKVVKVIKREK